MTNTYTDPSDSPQSMAPAARERQPTDAVDGQDSRRQGADPSRFATQCQEPTRRDATDDDDWQLGCFDVSLEQGLERPSHASHLARRDTCAWQCADEHVDHASRAPIGNRSNEDAQASRIRNLQRGQSLFRGIIAAVQRFDDRDELLRESCRIVARAGGFALARISIVDGATGRVSLLASCQPALEPATDGSVLPLSVRDLEGDPVSSWVAREERSLVLNALTGDHRWVPLCEHLPGAGEGSAAAFPLSAEGRLVAVLLVMQSEPAAFDESECEQLTQVAADLSFALGLISRLQRLRFMGYHDALTGMANGNLFTDRVNQLIVAADASVDQHCIAVVVLDIEHFSDLNAMLGMAVCDELLRSVGQRLCAALPAGCSVARITADTFAVAGASAGDDAATALLERLLDVLQEPVGVDGVQVPIAVQLGVALFPADGADADSLFKNAISALREARTTGSRYAYYSPELSRRVAEKRRLEVALRNSIEQRHFTLHYQPRIDLVSGCMMGAEALIRWQHPTEGLVSPLRFIPLAEETGLIVELGAWAINEVCRQQAEWLAAGLPAIPVAVNLSSVQFAKSDLLQTVKAALHTQGLLPGLLELELTESAVMLNPRAARDTLRALRELGCSLALDDFGTGYSSLAHLKRFPFDVVKIDRGFVNNITSNREDAAIATAIIAMAHQMELLVIAEGVETLAQLELLRGLGCDQIQGYLFSAAVPAVTFAGYLREHRRLDLSPPGQVHPAPSRSAGSAGEACGSAPANPTAQKLPRAPVSVGGEAAVVERMPHRPSAYPGAANARPSARFPSADAVVDALPRVDHRLARSRPR